MTVIIEGEWFRRVMGCVPTPVTVVTAMDDDEPVAMVIGSFGSVSLDPPLVMFMPGVGSTTWPRIERSGRFCVNVMGDDQLDVAQSFFAKEDDPFEINDWDLTEGGSPRLAGSPAWIDCDIDKVVEAGDHYIVLGRVLALHGDPERLPLVFFGGGYGSFREL